MNDIELHEFFEDFVRTLRNRGVVCAITSGLACVHYGIAESTKDCDLLCHTSSFGELLELLEETQVDGECCRYRGNISPPLDARWHNGGWTSHFEWGRGKDGTQLDVFGRAIRESSPWEEDLSGVYAGLQVVGEMKRTDRDKDWPFVTSVGEEMLARRDTRGWMHLFDEEILQRELQMDRPPDEAIEARPALGLAIQGSPELGPALFAERVFWKELDRIRIRLMKAPLRKYLVSVVQQERRKTMKLRDQHEVRVSCAEECLPRNPVADYGIERYLKEARESTERYVNPSSLQWLPDVREYFASREP